MSFSQWLPQLPDNALTSDLIVMGWMVALVVNVFVNVILLILLCIGQLKKTGIRSWLLIVNFLFFTAQITILIINRNLK